MNNTLFERIGGENAVRAAVVKMYDKILSDESLAPFFENINVNKLRLSQIEFITCAFGGNSRYNGASLRAAHKNAVQSGGLTDIHFNLVAMHLKSAMQELGVADDLIAEALAIVETTRADVLNQ